jgi:hypothetical protein
MIHYYIWNFVLEVSSVALAAVTIYGIVSGAILLCSRIGKFIDEKLL